MVKNLTTVLYFLFELQLSFAQNVIDDERGKRLSINYYQGSALIYDCNNKHWVCVDKMNYEKCQKERNDYRIKKFLNLPCAPLKVFSSVEACLAEQNRQVTLPKRKDFCLFEKP
ncbi:MAG: hypothetical protein U0T83_06120 [Bacteriovoracaceae bacterium]